MPGRSAVIASLPLATMTSQAIMASADNAGMRAVCRSSGVFAMRMCDSTERPSARARSCRAPCTPLPSRCAAMPISAPIVTTPVPPMPVISDVVAARRAQAGRRHRRARAARRPPALRHRPALAQAAALHGDEARAEALRRRNSPCCRTTGRCGACGRTRFPAARTDTQFDCTPQSPQPSHTELVDEHALAAGRPNCRACGGGASRRRRSGRRSSTVTPGDLAQLALHRVELVAVVDRDADGGEAIAPVVLVGLVGHDDDALHALAAQLLRDASARSSWPSTGWPPVIATRVVVEDLVGDVDARPRPPARIASEPEW